MNNLIFPKAFACLLATTVAVSAETISIEAHSPELSVNAAEGIGTANAHILAEMTRKDASDYCSNWFLGRGKAVINDCIKTSLDGDNTKAEISADCDAGSLTDPRGRKFTFAGAWDKHDDIRAPGRFRFKDETGTIVEPNNAAGGLTLAHLWTTLCPQGFPTLDTEFNPYVKKRDFALASTKDTDHPLNNSLNIEPFIHNDSFMHVSYRYGLITYHDPKPSIAGTIPPNTLLFQGRIEHMGEAIGVAYTFKKGCEPAPYFVIGYYHAQTSTYFLHGKAPLRSKTNCDIIGYSDKSPNATLKLQAYLMD
ncbi:hypothetical protein [Neorhizobium sp. LjRoot104]|uniref:hypothetical protein n=1 Tax=Neorhizobium sp. LjRoot104 TaxID=3342254 RepID=UPI003ED0D4FB